MTPEQLCTCPLADRCAFYQRNKNFRPDISQQLKQEYCRGDFGRCARLRVHDRVGNEWVPLQMLPYHREWAEDILTDVTNSGIPVCPQAPAPDAF
ncbi:MAG: hypothetical protein LLF76_02435 [Planctomycetaceae bacterium]|nr:hypothetical protein [Planctomycetaceae bacterium]